ncbi:hypothetical protein ATCM_18975 [Stenotrophomonas sp. ATCM1_4]|nr:hypothetical protein ATCM_18975 [Stenotrophomonas sp. ATCM1_4]
MAPLLAAAKSGGITDEAQRFFRASSGTVPSYIEAMETIRHAGIRLILLTQSPLLIHANIRALVGLHEHLVRQNGKELSTVYRRSRVMDNVRSEKALLAEDHESWAFPKECYGLYKSAEVHTVKRTLSSKAKRGIVLAIIAASLVGYAIWNGKNLFSGGKDASGDTAAAGMGASATGAAAAGLLPSGASPREVRYSNALEYAKAHLPRFASMPETAPIFDGREPVSQPALYCMSSVPGGDDGREASCTCLTEQGTKYDISQPECRTLARFGPVYNPYKAPKVEAQAAPVALSGAPATGTSAGAPAGAVVGYKPGQRADTFPQNPAKPVSSYTPPTSAL